MASICEYYIPSSFFVHAGSSIALSSVRHMFSSSPALFRLPQLLRSFLPHTPLPAFLSPYPTDSAMMLHALSGVSYPILDGLMKVFQYFATLGEAYVLPQLDIYKVVVSRAVCLQCSQVTLRSQPPNPPRISAMFCCFDARIVGLWGRLLALFVRA